PSRGFSTKRSNARMSLIFAVSRNFRQPYLTKGIFRRVSSTSSRSAVTGGAEEDRLLFEHRSTLAILQHALRDVASLVGFVAHADELWSRGGVSIGPQVLGEALSPQTDDPICRC